MNSGAGAAKAGCLPSMSPVAMTAIGRAAEEQSPDRIVAVPAATEDARGALRVEAVVATTPSSRENGRGGSKPLDQAEALAERALDAPASDRPLTDPLRGQGRSQARLVRQQNMLLCRYFQAL